MNVVFYAQHVRDYFWVQPIWQELGGTFVSELPEIEPLFKQYAPEVPFHLMRTKRRLTVGRATANRRLTVKNKATRLQLEQIARELEPDVIITTSNHRHAMGRAQRDALFSSGKLKKKTRQVQAFHGVSSKNVKFNPWMSEFDLLLLPGRRERDKFAALGVLSQAQFAMIGHPKSDRILRGEITRASARQQFNLRDRPTVLYAPTHGSLSSFFTWGEAICRAVPEDCNLIVKPHPVLTSAAVAEGVDAPVLDRIKNYLEERGALWLPLEPDVVPLMAASDLLITDYSSVAEEYLVFNRPLLFCDHLAKSEGRDRQQRDKGDWNELFSCGAHVTDISQLQAEVETCLSSPQKNATQREKMRDYVFENLDGHCAKRAAKAIRAICD